mgnify:CR=1 FL=1
MPQWFDQHGRDMRTRDEREREDTAGPAFRRLFLTGLRNRGDHWSVDRHRVDHCRPVAFPRVTAVLGLGDLDGYSGRRSQRKDP